MKFNKIPNFILIILLGLVGFGIYANALNGDFLIDDQSGILNNERIHDINTYFSNFKIHLGVLYDIARLFHWQISGDNPFYYHLFDILAHVGCVILLFVLCNLLFNNKALSFLSSFIFAVHPIHTEAVSWISGANYVYSTIFFMAAFVFYIKSARNRLPLGGRFISNEVKSNKSILYLLLATISFSLCLLTGNTAATLPIMFILYELFFRERDIQDLSSRRFRIIFLFLILLISVIFVVSFFVARNKYIHLIFSFRGFNYLIVAAKAFVYYLKILYLPLARGLYHPFAFNTTDIQNISPALFLSIVVLIITAVSFFKCKRNLKPVSFGIMWFFVTYLPYSNIIPICNIISERYLYLPSVGFSIIMAALFLKVWEIINRKAQYRRVLRYISIVAVTLFLGSYATLTIRRNYDYHNIITYWRSNINNFPDGYIVYNNLAGTFYAMGDLNNAEAYCYTTLMVNQNQPHVWCNLGKIYGDIGDFKQARWCYKEAIKIDENYFPAHIALNEIEARIESSNL